MPPAAYQHYAAHAASARALAVRANTLVNSAAEVWSRLTDAGFAPQAVSWCDTACVLDPAQRTALTRCGLYAEHRFYIQNPASMLPSLLLAPQAEDWVLDLAAAPGGKTQHLACLMHNQGRISAVEPVKSRFHRLRANLDAYGVRNTRCYQKDGTRVWRLVPERFDHVLLDAPCSSESRFRLADPASYAYWSERKIKETSRKQRRLLYSALQCLKPGGSLVYCTCAFAPEENEAVVDYALRSFAPALSVEPLMLPKDIAVQRGLTAWQGKPYHADLANAVRVLPDTHIDGFFICKLRKQASTLPDTDKARRP